MVERHSAWAFLFGLTRKHDVEPPVENRDKCPVDGTGKKMAVSVRVASLGILLQHFLCRDLQAAEDAENIRLERRILIGERDELAQPQQKSRGELHFEQAVQDIQRERIRRQLLE
ncbi:hypothetical protein D3C73_1208230 [compost metagenome]